MTFGDFQKLNLRIGKIVKVEMLPNPKHTTHKITIDFGDEIGQKVSCGRFINYSQEELLGKTIVAALGLESKKIGDNISEVLTLGSPDDKQECILLQPDNTDKVILGSSVY